MREVEMSYACLLATSVIVGWMEHISYSGLKD